MLDASGCDWQTRCNTMARYYNPTATPSEYYPPYSNPMGYQCQHPGYEHNNNMYAANPLMESYISSSSTRLARNAAEKQRRTKLNTYIDELRSLVPMVSSSVAARSGKKVDKTSILRLSATFLRMHQILYGNKTQLPPLPPELKKFNWSQFILDDMDGILLLVTSAGKIVFISHSIDKILGHNQTELFGQSLYSFTCPEDHDELRKNLSPDLDPTTLISTPALTNAGGYCELSGDEGGEESCASSQSSPRSSSASPHPRIQTCTERQKRSFYLRLRQKGCSRSEKPQYELVHVLGHLRITRRQDESSMVTRRSRKPREMAVGSNDVVLVAVIRPFKERRVTELSLMEATREEYITRHLKDGRIIYCDHRISFVSGYMSTEIAGLSGFMFMHKEDMKWAMIALRQMYIGNESYGSSCYRLLDKSGKFFYIRTYGYLEFDPSESYSEDYFPSFICINTLLSEEEGEAEIRNMKARFTPLIENKVEAGILAIAGSSTMDNSSHRSSSTDSDSPFPLLPAPTDNSLSDPDELKVLIKSLISNIPSHGPKSASPNSSAVARDDSQYYKLQLAAKGMPPASVHAKMGINMKAKEDKRHDRKEEILNAPVSAVQNRPSVLRGPCITMRANERGGGVLVTTKRMREEDVFVENQICDKKARSCYEGSGVLVSPQSCGSYCQSPVDPVVSTSDNISTSTYLNLDMQDGMVEAPSFIIEEETQHTAVHSSEMFQLWEETQATDENISSLADKSSLRLPNLKFSSHSVNSLKQLHKSPNSSTSQSIRHSFPS